MTACHCNMCSTLCFIFLEHGLHNGTTLYTETSNQNISAPVSTSTIVASAQPSNDTEVQKAEGQSEVATPPVTAHVDPPVKRRSHTKCILAEC